MMIKEYLQTFSNTGDITVTVKFARPDASIAPQRMSAAELVELIDPQTGCFLREMRFDEHLLPIRKFEIDPQKNRLIIHVGE